MLLVGSYAHHLSCPQQHLVRLRPGRRLPDVIAKLGYLPVQRLDLFVNAGLYDLHQLEQGLQVDDGAEANHVNLAHLRFRRLPARLVSG